MFQKILSLFAMRPPKFRQVMWLCAVLPHSSNRLWHYFLCCRNVSIDSVAICRVPQCSIRFCPICSVSAMFRLILLLCVTFSKCSSKFCHCLRSLPNVPIQSVTICCVSPHVPIDSVTVCIIRQYAANRFCIIWRVSDAPIASVAIWYVSAMFL